jgi:hypothetical protein
VKKEQKVVQALGAAALFSLALAGCDSGPPVENAEHLVRATEEMAAKDRGSAEKITVRGLLRHYPQDVKSTEAWLGHEFIVGETPIRTTEKVPRDVLMKMVGENVEIEGLWNAGEKWEPPKPAEETMAVNRPYGLNQRGAFEYDSQRRHEWLNDDR